MGRHIAKVTLPEAEFLHHPRLPEFLGVAVYMAKFE